ncbi:MAG: hypothetical protein LRY53_03875 [Burkholderiaceae bacterium]|nr:hypothetical protein [Burkholderiaceae bacterium]MCD8516642.1 hypothetical protein [Burkholderiaceae bacterium]MCD8537956.1 hypothetical protein [Burkholderiaceae bacterium]MCD8564784.1 hypothetical protein [Burkholderiaceae bacterium]
MNDANNAQALLSGEIDVEQYWRESGEQQVKSAGVLLTQKERDRALRNLARLTVSLRDSDFEVKPSGDVELTDSAISAKHDLQQAFENYLATYQ